MKKGLIVFLLVILSSGISFGASLIKDSQADFMVSGSSFESTTAAVEPESIVLEIKGGEGLWAENGRCQ